MKAIEIRPKSSEELNVMQEELTTEIFNLRLRRKTIAAQPSDGSRLKSLRRDLARINTVIHGRETGKEQQVTA